jgi:exodeoxyribonuclease VII small subunit
VVDRGGPSGAPDDGGEGVSGELSFEEARAELEHIVARLESGEAGLEDAISMWERGEHLYRFCLAKLDAAQGRVEELGQELAGGPEAGVG